MIVEQVLGTRNNESKWLCIVRCQKHANATITSPPPPDCVICQQVHVLRANTAKNYIRMQVKHNHPVPTFTVEWTGPKCKNLRNNNRDPNTIYRLVKFVGFKRPSLEIYDGVNYNNNNHHHHHQK